MSSEWMVWMGGLFLGGIYCIILCDLSKFATLKKNHCYITYKRKTISLIQISVTTQRGQINDRIRNDNVESRRLRSRRAGRIYIRPNPLLDEGG